MSWLFRSSATTGKTGDSVPLPSDEGESSSSGGVGANPAKKSRKSKAEKEWVKVHNDLWVPVIAKSSQGHVFHRQRMENGVKVWSDRDYRYSNVPEEMIGGTQLYTKHRVAEGTIIRVDTKTSANIYIITEKEGNPQRDGNLISRLKQQGWSEMVDAPSVSGYRYGGKPQVVFRLPVAPGVLELPETQSELCLSIVAVNRGRGGERQERIINNNSNKNNIRADYHSEGEQKDNFYNKNYSEDADGMNTEMEVLRNDSGLQYPCLQFSDIGISRLISQSFQLPPPVPACGFLPKFDLEEEFLQFIAKKRSRQGEDISGSQEEQSREGEAKRKEENCHQEEQRGEGAAVRENGVGISKSSGKAVEGVRVVKATDSMETEEDRSETPGDGMREPVVRLSSSDILVRSASQLRPDENVVQVIACMVVDDENNDRNAARRNEEEGSVAAHVSGLTPGSSVALATPDTSHDNELNLSSREPAWTCARCTFLNANVKTTCEMCGFVRN